MTLQAAALAAESTAALTAVVLARRRAEHRPAAAALVLLVAAAALELPILAALRPLPRPIEGNARTLVYLDGALCLASIAAVPGLALAVSISPGRRRAALASVAGAWLVASVALAALYPSPVVRGEGLRRVYLAADLMGLLASIVALAWWARLRRSPGSAHMIAMGLVLLDLGILLVPFSPWRGALFAGRYDVVQLGIVIFFAAFTAGQGVLWRFSSR